MRPRKVTVVRYMIIYINIYIYIYMYTDSAGVDRTRRGSLRLAPMISYMISIYDIIYDIIYRPYAHDVRARDVIT